MDCRSLYVFNCKCPTVLASAPHCPLKAVWTQLLSMCFPTNQSSLSGLGSGSHSFLVTSCRSFLSLAPLYKHHNFFFPQFWVSCSAALIILLGAVLVRRNQITNLILSRKGNVLGVWRHRLRACQEYQIQGYEACDQELSLLHSSSAPQSPLPSSTSWHTCSPRRVARMKPCPESAS